MPLKFSHVIAACLALSLGQSAVFAASENFSRGYQAWDQGDYPSARKFLTPVAKQGDLDAQNHLGQMEEDGQGSAVNLRLAVRWYRQAAESGHPSAQLNLGRMYRSGKGVVQDDTRAVSWYRKAADQGLSIAQFFMGLMYDTGKGVPSDYTQAYKWFDLAARQGDEDARYKRDRLARQMTPSQVLQAEQLAASFLGEDAPASTALRAQQGGRELPVPASLLASTGTPANSKPLVVASIRPADQTALVLLPGAGAQPPAAVSLSRDALSRDALSRDALSRDELMEVQKTLNSLGYYAGTPDGSLAGRTTKAIALYRTDTGKDTNAPLDTALLAELKYTRANLGPEPAATKRPKELVQRIQAALNTLGYDTGTPDGVIGTKTIAAARKYRADMGYKVRDELTQGLRRVTETRIAVIRQARTNVPRNSNSSATRRLASATRSSHDRSASGDSATFVSPTGGELIKRTQRALTKLGYKPGPVDGATGAKTVKAVRAYQSKSGLKADGQLSAALLSRLEGSPARKEQAGPRLRFVRPASQRELVRRAQVRLNSLGYSAGAPDGLPGEKTTSAIREFQIRERLRPDSRLSESILRRLEQPDAAKPAGRQKNLSGAPLVREIQAELNRLGYPAGSPDGIIGRRTVDAARAYQKAVGLSTSGRLTPALLQSLRAAR